jgi:hypothetical protein
MKLSSGFPAVVVLALVLQLVGCGGDKLNISGAAAEEAAQPSLASLTLSSAELDQIFQPSQLEYTSSVGFLTASTAVTPTAQDDNARVTVNGSAVASASASEPVFLGQGENVITVMVIAEDGATTGTYSISVTRQSADEFAQQAYIKASNAERRDAFGHVALSGDTLAVGAPWESSRTGIDGDQVNNSSLHAGAVYVFTREGMVWEQQAYIKASNIDIWTTGESEPDQDHFGEGVAIYGDTLAVGAPFEDSAASGINGNQADNSLYVSGAVYVFTREGTEWSQQAYIKASNPDVGDGFGFSVALDEDTLAVGAYSEDSAATGIDGDQADNSLASGAVYVFTREGTQWSQQAYVKTSNPGEYDNFAYVALSGDTLAVGAPFEDSAASGINGDQANNSLHGSGAVYVFTREGTQWSQQAYIKASNPREDSAFGIAIALSGDTLVLGGRREAVYVFTREGTVWSQQDFIKASNANYEDGFGGNVALSGDTLAVGAQGEDSAATGIDGDQMNDGAVDSGAAYVYH